MLIPIRGRLHHRGDELIDVRKPASLEGQTAQLLPPRLDQIQPARILGNEPQRDLRPSDQCRLRVPREVGTQIVGDQHPLPRGISLQHLLQELREARAITPRATQRGGQASRRLKGAQHPHAAPAAVVRGKGGAARAFLPDLTGIRLGTYGPEFVEANDPPLRARLRVGLDDGPLFSTKAASTLTWNQLCWRFQTKPSAWSHFQMVAGVISN